VGFFGYWVIVRGASEKSLRLLGLDPYGEGQARGWLFGAGRGNDPPEDLGALVAQASAEGGAAVGAFVYDSDFGYIVGAEEGRATAHLVVKPALAREYDFDATSDPESFAAWSQVAPRPVRAEDVQEILTEEWVFAEEGVDALFERVGLPAPYDPHERADPRTAATVQSVNAVHLGGYEAPLGWMSDVFFIGDQQHQWRDSQFVPGVGRDFLGIWDRRRPGEPAHRFPRTSGGDSRLKDELDRLHEPLLLETLDVQRLEGFRRPLEQFVPTIRLAERELSLREARFVPGYGDGFVGVWDREKPGGPIERFPDNFSGERSAHGHAYQALLEHELAQKQLPGRRFYLPRVPPSVVAQGLEDFADVDVPEHMREQVEAALREGWYSEEPSGPWLLAEEDEDARWPPTVSATPGPWYLYTDHDRGLSGGPTRLLPLGLACEGSFATLEAAQSHAWRRKAKGEWTEVPSEVPRNLLSTSLWLAGITQVATERWFERFEPITTDLSLNGDRSFSRLFDPEIGVPDSAIVVAAEGIDGEPTALFVRIGDAPRFVYSLDDPDVLRGMLPNYVHERRFGEWREISDRVPRTVRETAEWVMFAAGLG
jgi:hypothetical protein